MKTPGLEPAFERMTRNLFNLVEGGWSPCTLSINPVIWQRREYNEIADFVVNFTMDHREDWCHVFSPPWPDFSIWDGNVLCHSDGGTRTGTCSAAGWYVEAVVTKDRQTHAFPYAMAGKFTKDPISAFTAETVALDDVITYMSGIICNTMEKSPKRVCCRQ